MQSESHTQSRSQTRPSDWVPSPRLARAALGGFGAAVGVQPLAELTAGVTPTPVAALVLGLTALAVGVAAGTPSTSHRRLSTGAVCGALGAGALTVLLGPGTLPQTLTLVLAGPASAAAAGRLGRGLPEAPASRSVRGRILLALWILVAGVGLVQTTRLASFVADPDSSFVLGSTLPFWNGHLCFPAYLHGAELALHGDGDPYDPGHWPALNREAEPESRFEGLAVDDPFQYPPQFLLLPAALMTLADDWHGLMMVWFLLQLVLFAGTYTAVARWIGGAAGRTILWMTPAVACAFPVLYNFQFGQFHLSTVCLAVLGLMAVQRGRDATGGALLCAAVLSKIFPAILLVVLAAQRRWRALGWTAAWGAALTVASLLVFGPAPFTAFVGEHLPRLGDGTAFAFEDAWPELGTLVVADNQGIFGLARKLGLERVVASDVARWFGLALLGLAFAVGRRLIGATEPLRLASSWLALLGLASLTSNGAWGDYVPSIAVWLVVVVLAGGAWRKGAALAVAATAPFHWFLLGTFPWGPPQWMIPVAGLGTLAMLGLYGGVLGAATVRRTRRRHQERRGTLLPATDQR